MATAIKYGMKGDDVKNLQTTLNNSGYKLDVDGNFGPQTLAAVKDYQGKNNLTVDGMVGPQTSASLWGGQKETTATTKPATNTNTANTVAKAPATGSTASATQAKDSGFTYEDFTYGNYAESETVAQAGAALQAALAAQPGAYQSKWQSQIDDMIGRILNREEFSYDVNEDALYKQYAEQYKRGGQLAMQDTMGQAASMTGGYGNSYAASVGNQAYQEYMSKLNEVVPELYGMAYDRYQDEGQEMYNQYGLLSDAEQQDYGRYQDEYNKWLTERDYATGRYDSERDYDYGKYVDERNFEYGKYADDKNYAYNEWRAAIGDEQWAQSFAETQKQNEIGNQQWDKSFAETVKQNEIGNEQWNKSFEETVSQNNYDNQYREDVRQDSKDSENRAYAREDVLAILANGGTPSERQLKIAGWTKDTAAAYAALSSGDSESALEHVASMSYEEIIDMCEGFAEDGNMFALEGAIDDAFLSGRIDKTEAQKLMDHYLKTGTATDTTVNTKPTYSGGGGGKIFERAW